MSGDDTQSLVEFFKALADETRLRVVGLLALREQSAPELAAALGMREQALARHLAMLAALGLVQASSGPTVRYRLDFTALQAMKRVALARERAAGPGDAESGEAWEGKVLRDFFDGERLKEIPANRKKRAVVLAWLADRFEHDARYPEPEVNAIIKRHHPDSAALRRELVDGRWMAREAGVYWRLVRE